MLKQFWVNELPSTYYAFYISTRNSPAFFTYCEKKNYSQRKETIHKIGYKLPYV